MVKRIRLVIVAIASVFIVAGAAAPAHAKTQLNPVGNAVSMANHLPLGNTGCPSVFTGFCG